MVRDRNTTEGLTHSSDMFRHVGDGAQRHKVLLLVSLVTLWEELFDETLQTCFKVKSWCLMSAYVVLGFLLRTDPFYED